MFKNILKVVGMVCIAAFVYDAVKAAEKVADQELLSHFINVSSFDTFSRGTLSAIDAMNEDN